MSEKVFNGHDNTIDLELREDNAAVDLSSITRIAVKLSGPAIAVIDSDAAGVTRGGLERGRREAHSASGRSKHRARPIYGHGGGV